MKRLMIGLSSALALGMVGCEQSQPPAQPLPTAAELSTSPGGSFPATINDHLTHSAFDSYLQAYASSEALQGAVSALIGQPDSATLAAARSAWRDSYSAFLRTRLYGFLPISDPVEWQRQGVNFHQIVNQIDSWPIEGGYLDYLPGYPFTGIVNDLALPLTPEALRQQHGFSDPASVSLGFHAIEFLLWGSDGQRDASDYVLPANNSSSSSSEPAPDAVTNQKRRRQYLQLVTAQLLDHQHLLQSRWQQVDGYYAQLVTSSTPSAALQAGMSACAWLIRTELLAKRLPGNSSEFSDTSQQDIQALLQGMQLWLLGNESQEGALISLLGDKHPELLAQWQAALTQALTPVSETARAEPADTSATPAEAAAEIPAATSQVDHIKQLDSLLQQTASLLRLTLPKT
ncbi:MULTISPECIES: imelysin family protein [unclassified Oceanobacter]|uniref:imelysin family protein n=2 Tax=Gammaproteobacteria TaxID=1236 RepID=UPI002733BD4B|nr:MULTISPECIES: imelysin family protein [unclassified Oceanobacter]MDP2607815.1 imelysin family protein [Oceanobacter sp. 1_MG-2023]MDP2611001.1 imelysin family protein [Oceanobacter sp. 2_MG-2023]